MLKFVWLRGFTSCHLGAEGLKRAAIVCSLRIPTVIVVATPAIHFAPSNVRKHNTRFKRASAYVFCGINPAPVWPRVSPVPLGMADRISSFQNL